MMDEEQKAILDQLEPMNVSARYPEAKEGIFRELSDEVCVQILHDTGVVFE